MPRQSTTEPYPLTRTQQDNIAMGIARTYDVKSITFVTCVRHKIAGSVHVIVEINDNPNLQSDIPYLDVKDLDNSGFQMGLNPIDEFYDLERNPYIPENEPVDISHIKITYLKD